MNNKTMNEDWVISLFCWVLTLVSTMGSLFFSEVMEFPPCILCWYQRIAMYPLVLIFLVGAFSPVKQLVNFSLPLVASGWMIAVYHNLLHFEVIPESASPCLEGVPCSTVYINWLGFITIPMLSFLSFSILLIILVWKKWSLNK